MASPQRIEDLKIYCKQWKESLDNAIKRRAELFSWKEQGLYIFNDDTNEDKLQDWIDQVDSTVITYQNILIKMESLRDRAINGEDV